MCERPFDATTVAAAFGDAQCDTDACVAANLGRSDTAWQVLELAATDLMFGGSSPADDMDEDRPPDDVMALVAAFDTENEEGLDEPDCDDDDSLRLFRKRRFRLIECMGALDWSALELFGKMLEALYDSFLKLDQDPALVIEIVEHLANPEAVLSFMEGFDPAAAADVEAGADEDGLPGGDAFDFLDPGGLDQLDQDDRDQEYE